jgi:hypothetical protein
MMAHTDDLASTMITVTLRDNCRPEFSFSINKTLRTILPPSYFTGECQPCYTVLLYRIIFQYSLP